MKKIRLMLPASNEAIRKKETIVVSILYRKINHFPGNRNKYTCGSHNSSNLFHTLQIGTETAVTTKDLFVDNCRQRQTIETICEGFPQLKKVIF